MNRHLIQFGHLSCFAYLIELFGVIFSDVVSMKSQEKAWEEGFFR